MMTLRANLVVVRSRWWGVLIEAVHFWSSFGRVILCVCFFFSSRRRHTRLQGDWSSDVCSSDLYQCSSPRERSAQPEYAHACFSGLHPGDLRLHGLRSYRGISRRGFPGEDTLYVAFASLSHRQRCFWRTPAAHRIVELCGDWQHSCGSLLPDDCRLDDLCRRRPASQGNARPQDLGRGWRDEVATFID